MRGRTLFQGLGQGSLPFFRGWWRIQDECGAGIVWAAGGDLSGGQVLGAGAMYGGLGGGGVPRMGGLIVCGGASVGMVSKA